MQAERKKPDSKAILDVFRDLGLEDAKERDKFQKLSELSDGYTLEKKDPEPQDTQNNTENEQGNTYA